MNRIQLVWAFFRGSLVLLPPGQFRTDKLLYSVDLHRFQIVCILFKINGFAFREDSLVQAVHNATRSGGMINCVMNIFRNEGILGFYKGLKVNIIKVSQFNSLNSSMSFV